MIKKLFLGVVLALILCVAAVPTSVLALDDGYSLQTYGAQGFMAQGLVQDVNVNFAITPGAGENCCTPNVTFGLSVGLAAGQIMGMSTSYGSIMLHQSMNYTNGAVSISMTQCGYASGGYGFYGPSLAR